MLTTADGRPEPVANPIFSGQADGALMLEEPLETRETRSLANLPLAALL